MDILETFRKQAEMNPEIINSTLLHGGSGDAERSGDKAFSAAIKTANTDQQQQRGLLLTKKDSSMLTKDEILERINAHEEFDGSDPYTDRPDHCYWSKVLPEAYKHKFELGSMLYFLRLSGVPLNRTSKGSLRMDLSKCQIDEDLFFTSQEMLDKLVEKYLQPHKKIVATIFKKARKQVDGRE